MEEQELYEYIEAYLAKSLSSVEIEQFEARLRTDEDFAEEFRLHKRLHEEYSSTRINEFRDLLREEAGKKSQGKVVGFDLRRSLSIAATVILMLSVAVYFFTNRSLSGEQLYSEFMDQPSFAFNGEVERGEDSLTSTTIQNLMQRVEQFYDQKNYTEALAVLNSVDVSQFQGSEDLINLRMGILYLLTDDPNNAISHFDKLNEMSEAVRWYKSMALLRLERTSEVPVLLRPLTQFENPKKEAAEEILKKLN